MVYASTLFTLCLALIVSGWSSVTPEAAAFWIPIIALANLSEIEALGDGVLNASLASVLIVAAAVLLPPTAVTLFVLAGLVYRRELRGDAPVIMSVFNRSQLALSGALAALGVTATTALLPAGIVGTIVVTLLAVVLIEVANTAFLVAMLIVRRGLQLRQALADAGNPFPRFALNAGASAMLALLVVVLVRDVGQWSVALMVIPFWLSHSAQKSARQAEDRAEELAARVRELEMLNRLGTDLLSLREPAAVLPTAQHALGDGLDTRTVTIAHEATAGVAIPIPGLDGGGLVVADDVSATVPNEVLEAVAALIGLTLTRLELEAELAATEQARTALSARILEEATHERSRIAMGVHDDVLPLFAASQMKIDTLELLIERRDIEAARAMAEAATQAVNDGITQLRETLEALRRSTLVPGTLCAALHGMLAELRTRSGVRGSLDAPDPMPALPFAVELLVFDTIRGCVANVEKHARATTLDIALDVTDTRINVILRDDGRGFDAAAVGSGSHGLALMRQRAELARGQFEVTGGPDAGTTVQLQVPT